MYNEFNVNREVNDRRVKALQEMIERAEKYERSLIELEVLVESDIQLPHLEIGSSEYYHDRIANILSAYRSMKDAIANTPMFPTSAQ